MKWIMEFFRRLFCRISGKELEPESGESYNESGGELHFQNRPLAEETLLEKLERLSIKAVEHSELLPTECNEFAQRLSSLNAQYIKELGTYEADKDKVLIVSLHPEKSKSLKREIDSIEAEIEAFVKTQVRLVQMKQKLTGFLADAQIVYGKLVKGSSVEGTIIIKARDGLTKILYPGGERIPLQLLKEGDLVEMVYATKYLVVKLYLRFFGVDKVCEFFDNSDDAEYGKYVQHELSKLGNQVAELSPSQLFEDMRRSYDSLVNFKNRYHQGKYWQELFSLEDMMRLASEEIKKLGKIKIEANLRTLVTMFEENGVTGEEGPLLESLSMSLTFLKEAALPYKNLSLYIVAIILNTVAKQAGTVFLTNEEVYKFFCKFGAANVTAKLLNKEGSRSGFASEFLYFSEKLKSAYSDDSEDVVRKMYLKNAADKDNSYFDFISLPNGELAEDLCKILRDIHVDYKLEGDSTVASILINTDYIVEFKEISRKLKLDTH